MADAGLTPATASRVHAPAEPASKADRPVAVAVETLRKEFAGNVQAVRDISLAIAEGEFISLLGPSGSGKTTLLMMIAGFQPPTRGRILAGGQDITRTPPAKRNFGVVFQSYALFPHMTVGRNVAYPLSARRVGRRERRRLVAETLELVGLQQLGSRRPIELSGGQQQRVALARALVYQPSVLLLDEPLGALDRALRERMQTELRRIHDTVGCTFLYVTHDQEEALTMSDRVVVMHNGRIEQVGSPVDVYSKPANEFVATFVGTANLVPAHVVAAHDDGARVRLRTGVELFASGNGLDVGDEVRLVLRPEQLALRTAPPRERPGGLTLTGVVERMAFAGSAWRYQISADGTTVDVAAARPAEIEPGDRVYLTTEEQLWAVRTEAAAPLAQSEKGGPQ